MTYPLTTRFLAILAVALIAGPLFAGTLDDAPFRVVLPNSDWKIDDSATQPMGDGVFLAATLGNAKESVKSVVIKIALDNASGSTLDKLCAGVLDALTDSAVTVLSQTDTTFLGYKAREFIFHRAQAGQTIHSEVIVFIAGKTGWAIDSLAPLEQKTEIEQSFTLYQKKPN